jgi:N-acetylgalactosamine-N,N'-diacetylbacillosaminyl-diphospho-undecaprenol 4-alpha-N-acetylgalactosaminyltransferase
MSKKICLLTDSLGAGGAEKMAANMSLSLVGKGYQVYVVSMINNIHYNFGGTLYNFGKIKDSTSLFKSFVEFYCFFKKESFDVIIDHRVRNNFLKESLFSKLIFKDSCVIYCVHHFDLSLYFTSIKNALKAKFPHVRKRMFVSVSKEAQKHLKRTLKIESNLIYNYVLNREVNKNDVEIIEKKDCNYLVAVGRLVKMKQFDVLIDCYKRTQLPENNINLLILGEGEEKDALQEQIENLDLDKHVKLVGFKKDVFNYIKNSKALILSSLFEGFPMVLIEALALKTPLIAFDCKSGPNEIIKHEVNGLIVPDQNSELLTKAMDSLLLDEGFYKEIKNNIENFPNPFLEDRAIKQWINLIESFN